MKKNKKRGIGMIMGRASDWPTMKKAARVLNKFNISYEARVVSAHRTPDWMFKYASTAAKRGLKVIVAGAGGAAHLPGMVASISLLPVIGVPVWSKPLDGLDALLSIMQMPAGVPVAAVEVGGAEQAGFLAARILGITDSKISSLLQTTLKKQKKSK